MATTSAHLMDAMQSFPETVSCANTSPWSALTRIRAGSKDRIHRPAVVSRSRKLPVGQEARQGGVGFAVSDLRAEHVCFRSRATRVGVRVVRHEAHVYVRGGQQLSS